MHMTQIFFSFQSSAEGGFEARAVGYDIFIQADSMEELKANANEAVACHFGDMRPLPVARLVGAQPNRFKFGSAKGEFTVPDDFNDPLPKEIEDLFWNSKLFPED